MQHHLQFLVFLGCIHRLDVLVKLEVLGFLKVCEVGVEVYLFGVREGGGWLLNTLRLWGVLGHGFSVQVLALDFREVVLVVTVS